jgi:ribosomal protein L29
MKASVLRDLTDDELLHERDEVRKKLFDLRIKKGMGDSSDQPLLLRTVRRDAARVETIVKQRGISA